MKLIRKMLNFTKITIKNLSIKTKLIILANQFNINMLNKCNMRKKKYNKKE